MVVKYKIWTAFILTSVSVLARLLFMDNYYRGSWTFLLFDTVIGFILILFFVYVFDYLMSKLFALLKNK
jgi:hypothetical protein